MNPHSNDFTEAHYASLLNLAKSNYKFVGYNEIEASDQFVLWRHDCDFSLNRALKIAEIEHEHGVNSTFFLNPHCAFYNLLEKGQAELVENIQSLGHAIGLHFDSQFYQISKEKELSEKVKKEAQWILGWFGVKPSVFSFHNPDQFLLSCDKESYGGLINCYAKIFKEEIAYCSDSNGYWRHQRLHDVLTKANDPKLQILTHPGWWQERPCYPRERIHRSIYGRADANINIYDLDLKRAGRLNINNDQ